MVGRVLHGRWRGLVGVVVVGLHSVERVDDAGAALEEFVHLGCALSAGFLCAVQTPVIVSTVLIQGARIVLRRKNKNVVNILK